MAASHAWDAWLWSESSGTVIVKDDGTIQPQVVQMEEQVAESRLMSIYLKGGKMDVNIINQFDQRGQSCNQEGESKRESILTKYQLTGESTDEPHGEWSENSPEKIAQASTRCKTSVVVHYANDTHQKEDIH